MTNRRPTAAEAAQADFRKSSYSGGGGNECVEVARLDRWCAVRDSKDTTRRPFVVRAEALAAFLGGVRRDAI